MLRKIAYHYMFKSTFIFDAIAVIPFRYFIVTVNPQDLLLIKLVRLLKLKVDFIPDDSVITLMVRIPSLNYF